MITFPTAARPLPAPLPAPAAFTPAPAGALADSSLVTLDGPPPADVVYARPSPLTVEPLALWSGPHADSISARMLSNGTPSAGTLADRWRGLGSALLEHLAAGGGAFRQTLALPDVSATEAADAPTPAVLDGVDDFAATLTLKIQTRSGQTVSLSIAVNDGLHGGPRGLQVQAASSGPLTEADGAALASLASGLERALEGLGQAEPRLELEGLLAPDAGRAFAGLELRLDNPDTQANGAPQTLQLKVQGDRRSLAMTGLGGTMTLDSAAGAPDTTDALQRQAAIERTLAQIDAAGDRGHADARMLAAFKAGFSQLQAPPPPEAAAPAVVDEGARKTESLKSGLADFEASFSADSARTNRLGMLAEQGHMAYRIGQQTLVQPRGAAGGERIEQVLSESTQAVYRRTRTLALDLKSGNFDETTVQDRRTVHTLIETDGSTVLRALRRSDEQQHLHFASLQAHRVIARHDTPLQRSAVERLA